MIIYKVTNLITGGVYIGATTLTLHRRKQNHLTKVKNGCPTDFHKAIKKYGEENFKWEEMCLCSFKEELDIMERYYIRKFSALEEPNYNRHPGGRTAEHLPKDGSSMLGHTHSAETKKKMSDARIEVQFTEEHKKNLSIARKKRVTKDSTRKKCSETSTGKINIGLFKVTSPEGEIFLTTKGLTQFCREHDLRISGFMKVLNGRTKKDNYKGWKIEKQEDYNGNH